MMLLSDAQAQLGSVSQAALGTETVPLNQALGRVAATDIESGLAIPPCDNSAMDGFAVRVADISDGVELPISQRIPAGSTTRAMPAGSVARIFTGASIPEGGDAVVIQENCQFSSSNVGDKVRILNSVELGANIRPRGQDIAEGATVVRRGQRLNAVDLSLLASIGKADVEVYQRLTVAIFSTGDELAEPGQDLKEGQIYNSNRPLLMALCEELGFETIDNGIVADTYEATKSALAAAAQSAHVVLSSGGVSVGEEDHVKPAIEALGSLDMWKVQIKPGKPMAYGCIADTPFLGLPGNPVSSFIVFQLLGIPLLRALQGEQHAEPIAFRVKAGFDKALTTREEFIRVKLQRDEHGELVADRFPNLSSGVMSSLSWADGLVRHDIDTAIKMGDSVDFLPLTRAVL